jgi:hypothetical protein
MSRAHLSISQRLAKTKSVEVKKEILHEWIGDIGGQLSHEATKLMKLVDADPNNPHVSSLFKAAKRLEAIQTEKINVLLELVDQIESWRS